MAMQYETSLEALVGRLSVSIKGELERQLLESLQAQVKPLLEQLAKDMTKNLYGAIHTAREPMSGTINVVLNLDGVEKARFPNHG